MHQSGLSLPLPAHGVLVYVASGHAALTWITHTFLWSSPHCSSYCSKCGFSILLDISLCRFFVSRWKRCIDFLWKDCSGERRQEKKDQRPSSNSGPTLFHGASATRYQSQSQILRLPLPYVSVIGVPLYSDDLKTYASRLVQCVGSAGDSV